MDKNSILQYKLSFDSIVRYIESDDSKERGSRYLVGIGIYFGKPKKKETFIYNSS